MVMLNGFHCIFYCITFFSLIFMISHLNRLNFSFRWYVKTHKYNVVVAVVILYMICYVIKLLLKFIYHFDGFGIRIYWNLSIDRVSHIYWAFYIVYFELFSISSFFSSSHLVREHQMFIVLYIVKCKSVH